MLFNSYSFLFAFLPVTLLGFYVLRTRTAVGSAWWLGCASLFFYGYWEPTHLALILASIAGNFVLSKHLYRTGSKLWLTAGIVANLATIGWFKYSLFTVGLFVANESIPEFIRTVALPLAISFFTFQQIAFLVDVFRKQIEPPNFSTYLLFVTLFPQLIAGPIVRFQDVGAQFERFGKAVRTIPRLAIVGLAVFVAGLAKKVLIADTIAPFSTAAFDLAARGKELGIVDSWLAMYAYTFQLYFDFSGYSDMAIGLGLMLGLKLPVNFFSPYKATSIIEFWRRWHITLSRFFRDYVYIPLGGNRRGRILESVNLLIVMTLVGLWHGAGWTFILWGFYHGLLLASAHGLSKLSLETRPLFRAVTGRIDARLKVIVKWALTFHLVSFGWVLFRADNLEAAKNVFNGLAFGSGFFSSIAMIDTRLYFVGVVLVAIAFTASLALPNTVQMINRLHRVRGSDVFRHSGTGSPMRLVWRFSPAFAVALGFAAYFSFATVADVSQEFLYFNF